MISLNGHKKGIKVIFGFWKISRKENREEKSKENKKILSVYDHGKDATVNVKYKSCEIGTRALYEIFHANIIICYPLSF